MSLRLLAGVLAAFFLATQNANADSVTIYAAASTTDAVETAIELYQGPDEIIPVFAGTSTLARQIAAGAPGDIFLAANEAWVDDLESREFLEPGTRINLLSNSLVLVTPRLAPISYDFANARGLDAALGDRRLAIADPDGVPAGIYAREALTARGEWDLIQDRLVYGDSVRAALTWVAQAEVGAAVVYRSDALTTMSVEVIGTYPDSSHDPIRYPLAIVAGHARPATIAFYEYLRGPEGRAVFEDFGFGTLEEN